MCQKNTNLVEYGYRGGSFEWETCCCCVGVVVGSVVHVELASLTKHPLNKVIKRHVSEMLIGVAALPPAL